MDDDEEEPGRIPAKPRIYNDHELEIIEQNSFARMEESKEPSHKTKVTVTTKKPNAAPQHQVIYPLPRIPSRPVPSSEAVIRSSESVESGTATQTSESGYSSAQTQRMGTKKSKKGKKKKKMTDPVITTAVLDLIKDGVECYKDGKYANALKSFKSVLKSQMVRKAQCDNYLVGNMLANIGTIYLRLEQYDHAVESLEKAERMMRRTNTKLEANPAEQVVPTDVPLAWVLNNLATAKCFRGEHKASLECYLEAIKDAELHEGESSKTEIANALHNVGRIGVLRRDYDMAWTALKKSLELQSKLYGAQSIEVVDTLNLIGFVHYSKGEFKRAISVFTDGLSIVTGTFGSVHEKVAVSLTNVGMVLEKEGDLTEALRCFATAREICEKYGLNSTNTTMHTAIRSENDIRRKLSLVQDVQASKQKREIMEARNDREGSSVGRPSFEEYRKAFTAQRREGPSHDRESFEHTRKVFAAQEGRSGNRRSFEQTRKTFAPQRDGPTSDRPSYDQTLEAVTALNREQPSVKQTPKSFVRNDGSKETIRRLEMFRVKKLDMKRFAASIDQTGKIIPSSKPTINAGTAPIHNDCDGTVCSVGRKVDVDTYAAYRDRRKTEEVDEDLVEEAVVEYREDSQWELDNSSMVEEDRSI